MASEILPRKKIKKQKGESPKWQRKAKAARSPASNRRIGSGSEPKHNFIGKSPRHGTVGRSLLMGRAVTLPTDHRRRGSIPRRGVEKERKTNSPSD